MHYPLPLPSTCSPVPAGGEVSTTFTISPKNALEPVRSLTVTFESNQLEGVMGHTQVQVVAEGTVVTCTCASTYSLVVVLF